MKRTERQVALQWALLRWFMASALPPKKSGRRFILWKECIVMSGRPHRGEKHKPSHEAEATTSSPRRDSRRPGWWCSRQWFKSPPQRERQPAAILQHRGAPPSQPFMGKLDHLEKKRARHELYSSSKSTTRSVAPHGLSFEYRSTKGASALTLLSPLPSWNSGTVASFDPGGGDNPSYSCE